MQKFWKCLIWWKFTININVIDIKDAKENYVFRFLEEMFILDYTEIITKNDEIDWKTRERDFLYSDWQYELNIFL